ncbi:GNAT family N-acetyltransferase [Neisseria weixii]|uniref:GNAT family N-acetyltransferase n=1 Tax=Neisseria weixii TaxID=1853276 RepID=A0A3N4MWN0_9NEIS|nr:GNAT family N-acetyltransferase [Neisseria weixii]ATD65701.1 diamine acetyltransferase [Neisseria weixii]RPD83599.1 GNAT family N-acetyltransferase [Neisseria weixii]RPD84179.1 GNAT family N-acetyltransferase [Neisseria weixii]
MSITIRPMQEQDIEQVWSLMRDLAVFEHYIDSFAITPQIVKERGFDKQPPDFYCLVADSYGLIGGMLVYYFLNYTAQNQPAVHIKELYVAENFRNQKIGEKLMHALYAEAKVKGCGQIKWTVAAWNDAGQRFYQRLGAAEDKEWLNYAWKVE